MRDTSENNHKIKSLQIVNVRFFNATAWYGINLAKELNEQGHTSLVVGLEGSESYLKAKEMNVPCVALNLTEKNPLKYLKLLFDIEKLIKEFKPDVVNCHRGEFFLFWAYWKKKYHFKLIRTRGDQRPAKNNLPNHFLYTKCADSVIVSNSRIARQLHEDLRVPEEQIHTIIGGVDTLKFKAKPELYSAVRAEYNYKPSDRVLCLIGRLDEVKGHKESLLALAEAKRKGANNLKLLAIGFDELFTAEELYSQAEELGIRDLIQVTGKINAVEDVINACDVGLLASVDSEAIARVALEIMACGLPLISSDVGVMPDLVSAKGRFVAGNINEMTSLFLLVNKALDDKSSEEYTFLQEIQAEQKQIMNNLDMATFVYTTLTVYQQQLNFLKDSLYE